MVNKVPRRRSSALLSSVMRIIKFVTRVPLIVNRDMHIFDLSLNNCWDRASQREAPNEYANLLSLLICLCHDAFHSLLLSFDGHCTYWIFYSLVPCRLNATALVPTISVRTRSLVLIYTSRSTYRYLRRLRYIARRLSYSVRYRHAQELCTAYDNSTTTTLIYSGSSVAYSLGYNLSIQLKDLIVLF